MKPTNPNRLTRQEQRLYDMLRRGGRYTVADITRELGAMRPTRAYFSDEAQRHRHCRQASDTLRRGKLQTLLAC